MYPKIQEPILPDSLFYIPVDTVKASHYGSLDFSFCWYISKNILNTLQDIAYQNYSYHAYLRVSFHKKAEKVT